MFIVENIVLRYIIIYLFTKMDKLAYNKKDVKKCLLEIIANCKRKEKK